MTEIFKTVLLLSCFGGALIGLLLCLKPITVKRFSAQWQYLCWILIALLTLFPVYKWVPQRATDVVELPKTLQTQAPLPDAIFEGEQPSLVSERAPDSEIIPLTQPLSLWDTMAKVWLAGCIVFLFVVYCNYLIFLLRKRKGAVSVVDTPILNEVKASLHIRRKVRLKMSPAAQSPLLVGTFWPVIYLPCRSLLDEQLRMVLLHELTHYKRGDLLFKWFVVFVNGVHWFNPLLYLLTSNVSESCEVACDMTVTRHMDESEQKTYMKTILALLE